MTRFRKIAFGLKDDDLLKEVRKCTGEWSTGLDAIKNLRDRLLDLQNHRCVYCQAPIEAEEVGYRELEHILPKNKSSRCTDKSGTSNDAKKRRATLGYPEFTFEPLNLAVSCKQCNTYKGMHDSLADRRQARPLKIYPQAHELIWFHPHFDRYATHITINDDFGFTGVTDGGRAVINECRLDVAEVLERKFYARAYARARHAGSVKQKIDALASGVELLHFSKAHASKSLAETCSISRNEARELLTKRLDASTVVDMQAFFESIKKYEKTAV